MDKPEEKPPLYILVFYTFHTISSDPDKGKPNERKGILRQ